MKRLMLMMLCAVLMMAVTGCQGWFNAIPKDAVMVKKITKEHTADNDFEYEGVLSQAAVKTLSFNAIRKYYDESLKIDDFQFELSAVNQNKITELFKETKVAPGPSQLTVRESMTQFDYKKALDEIPGGLYYVTLTRSANVSETYDVVLNARDGEILKISKTARARTSAESNQSERVFDIADRFLQDKINVSISDLTFREDLLRWSMDTGGFDIDRKYKDTVEVFYTDKQDNKQIRYCIVINTRTSEVTGFSKDIMALLNYSRL